MALWQKTILFCNISLESFNPLVGKFYYPATFLADKMIVVLFLTSNLKSGFLFSEMVHARNTTLNKQFKGSVDSCIAHPGMSFFYLIV